MNKKTIVKLIIFTILLISGCKNNPTESNENDFSGKYTGSYLFEIDLNKTYGSVYDLQFYSGNSLIESRQVSFKNDSLITDHLQMGMESKTFILSGTIKAPNSKGVLVIYSNCIMKRE